jgi:Spy/CpxP family protein refolding chaperone
MLKQLKHSMLALTLASAVIVVPAALAQDNGSNAPQAAPDASQEHGRRGFDPEKRTEMLTKELKLTSDQQPKVLDILKSAQSQMQGVRSDSSLSQDDRRSKMMEIRKSSDDQVRALLDAGQQKKFDAMQSKHEQWRGHQGGQGAPDSSPQQN